MRSFRVGILCCLLFIAHSALVAEDAEETIDIPSVQDAGGSFIALPADFKFVNDGKLNEEYAKDARLLERGKNKVASGELIIWVAPADADKHDIKAAKSVKGLVGCVFSLCTGLRSNELMSISQMPELRLLDFSYCKQLQDGWVMQLARLKKLEVIILRDCPVVGASANTLSAMESLRYIDVRGTDISPTSLEALRKKFPEMPEVSIDPRKWQQLPAESECPGEFYLATKDWRRAGGELERGKWYRTRPLVFAPNANITAAQMKRASAIKALVSLEIWDASLLTTAMIEGLAESASLECLDVRRCTALENSLHGAKAVLENLKSLCLSECAFVDDKLLEELMPMPRLMALDLSGCGNITDDGVSRLAPLPLLQSVLLVNAAKVTDAGLLALADNKRLVRVDARGTLVSKWGTDQLREMTPTVTVSYDLARVMPDFLKNGRGGKLTIARRAKRYLPMQRRGRRAQPIINQADIEFFAFEAAPGLTRQELQMLLRMNRLVSLDLTQWPGKFDEAVPPRVRSQLERLALNFRGHTLIETDAFARFDALSCLELEDADLITDADVQSLAAARWLESLTLTDNQKVTDESIRSLAALGWLWNVDFSGCSRVTGEGFRHFSEGKLKVVSLDGCRISDGGLAHIAALPALEILSLSGNSELSAKALTVLGACKNLVSLDLSNCPNVDDSTLAEIAKLKNLVWLNLAGCTRITDAGLNELGKLRNLALLNITGCKRINERAADELFRGKGFVALVR